MRPVTILHISDLHFCSLAAKAALEGLRHGRLADWIGDLEIQYADSEVLDALGRLVADLDPDAIALTGDVTSLGDKESFQLAREWLMPLTVRGSSIRPVVLVPGNHDALRHHLAFLVRKKLGSLPIVAHAAFRWAFRSELRAIESFLEPVWRPDDTLQEFRDLCSADSPLKNKVHALRSDSAAALLVPFSTVSSDPWWMNAGEARVKEFQRLRDALREHGGNPPGAVKILLAHHNPISSPGTVDTKIAFAYNGMPGGTHFMRELQQAGVDLLLHGHQHASAVYSYDFDLATSGHAFTIACPASASAEHGGCNFLRVHNPNLADVATFSYDNKVGRFVCAPGGPHQLALERNRPLNGLVHDVRFEIKRYFFRRGDDETTLWRELQDSGMAAPLDSDDAAVEATGSRIHPGRLIYLSGRKLGEVRDEGFSLLQRILKTKARLRILLSDPDLVRSLSSAGHGAMWGQSEGLEVLAHEAGVTLQNLRDFSRTLSQEQRGRLDVRLSHTLLPFGALVIDADRPWGKMAVKILPVGGIGDLSAPIVRLNRRSDDTLFDYYLSHLRFLMSKATTAQDTGQWGFGDGDLAPEAA